MPLRWLLADLLGGGLVQGWSLAVSKMEASCVDRDTRPLRLGTALS